MSHSSSSSEEKEDHEEITSVNVGSYAFPMDKVKDLKIFGEDERELDFGSILDKKKCVLIT